MARCSRTQHVHAGHDLEYRLVRPVGCRARQGARQADHPPNSRATPSPRSAPRHLHQHADPHATASPEGGVVLMINHHGIRRQSMQLGMIGLGRMGANLVRHARSAAAISCVAYDANPGRGASARWPRRARTGANVARRLRRRRSNKPRGRLADAAGRHRRPDPRGARAPPRRRRRRSSTAATPTTATTSRRAKTCAGERASHYIDCGTSGGVFGLDRGYCLMIGGQDEAGEPLDPIFKTIAPGIESRRAELPVAPATPRHRRTTATCTAGRTAPATS